MKKILILVLCLFTLNINAQVDSMSTTPNFVNDFENIFSTSDEQMLNNMIKTYKDKTSIEIYIVTTDEVFESQEKIDDFSDRCVDSSELNNGLIVVISLASRKWVIVTDYGLKGLYTGDMSKRLIELYLKPNFLNGDYALGVKEFLTASMDEIGYEGYEQLLQKQKAEEAQRMKNYGITILFIIFICLFVLLIVYLIKKVIKKVRERVELSDEIALIHNDIMLRKRILVEILKKVPIEIEKVYDDNITKKNVKVDQDTLSRLQFVQSVIKDYQNLIYNTNRVITSILSEEREVEKYLKGNYDYCKEYLIKDLKSFAPDTTTDIFTTTDFSVDRLNKLRNLNNSLSSKLQRFLKKTYTISTIVSASKEIDDRIEELENLYEKYKEGKKSLITSPIGKRLSDLAKIDIVGYISNIKEEANKSLLKLKDDDYKGSNYHHSIYVTTLSVLLSTFGAVTNLISSYKRSDRYVKEHKNDYNEKIKNIEDEINKSGVKYSRKNTLKRIRAKIKKFHNNIAYDVIFSATLLKEILDEFDKLYSDIKSDITLDCRISESLARINNVSIFY